MAFVDELAGTVAAVAAACGPAVVRIGRDGGRGAGFVVADGQVVTSAHNLRGPTVTVTFAGGRVANGAVKGVDADGDLAVIAVDTAGAAPLRWDPVAAPAGAGSDGAGMDGAAPGQPAPEVAAPGQPAPEVAAPGQPAPDGTGPALGRAVFAVAPGRGATRVTFGHVSAVGVAFRGPRGRLIGDGFEHTAPIGRGSSGGPVVDAGGNLIGVNTHRPGDGLYLAIPATAELADRLAALGRGEAPARRRLGVAVAPAHVARRLRAAVGLPPRDGLLVRDVEPGGPAEAAGLRQGDLIVAVGSTPVDSLEGLLAAVDAAAAVGPAGPVPVTVIRGAEEVNLEIGAAGG